MTTREISLTQDRFPELGKPGGSSENFTLQTYIGELIDSDQSDEQIAASLRHLSDVADDFADRIDPEDKHPLSDEQMEVLQGVISEYRADELADEFSASDRKTLLEHVRTNVERMSYENLVEWATNKYDIDNDRFGFDPETGESLDASSSVSPEL